LSTAEIDKLIATNFYGVMYVMRAVLPVMRKQRSGRIINVSSLAGIVGFKHCGAYSAAKFAVEGLSASVAHEVEPFGIKIVAVEPGFFRTDLLDLRNAKYARSSIEDYSAEGKAEDIWSGYNANFCDPLRPCCSVGIIIGVSPHAQSHWMPPMQRYFVSRYSSMPYFDPSRPLPLSLMPPKGASSVEMIPSLMPTIP
jgi:short chain dehydrogenase